MIGSRFTCINGSSCSRFFRAWCSSSAKHAAGLPESNRFLTKAVVEETLKNKKLKFEDPVIGLDVVESLERLSLVNFANEAGLLKLRETVRFATALCQVETAGVEPLITVLENS